MIPLLRCSLRAIGAALSLAFAATLSAQTTLPPAEVTDLSFADVVQTAVRNQGDLTGFFGVSGQAVNMIPGAVGNGGAAVYTGLNGNNTEVIGNGVAGQVTVSWNVTVTASLQPLGFGGQVGTQLSGTTTISWKTITGSDGLVHIQVTITVGTNSANITRVIEIARPVPVSVLKPLEVNTPAPTSGTVSSDEGSNAFGWEDSNAGNSWIEQFLNEWEQSSLADVPEGQVTIGELYLIDW